MITRREWLRLTGGVGAGMALGLSPRDLLALQTDAVRTRAIPSTGVEIPIIGLGGRWININSTEEELADHRAVLHALAEGAEGAGRLFDSAAGYGRGGSETYAGEWAEADGFAENIFWATKVNVAPRGGGDADPTAVREQIERSFDRLRVDVIDLNQVHNLGDPPTQLGILQEYKQEGKIRHIGMTTTSSRRYGDLMDVMREYPLDFIGIDYAIDNRAAAEEIFPLAQDRGIAVMVYLPFGRSRMWSRIGDRPLPEWAAEFDAHTWAQFMLKFVVAHPAVTVAAPGTGDPEHMVDNLGGGRGRLPSEEHLKRMVELVDSLPDG
ncbi:MAG: aldo/keto reductase [Rhodothermales bacterium]|nr:aldo/keto reductase [Rhodothermales bacterium]MBO6780829.1 aldo/keto reductase [Rhodothermales bacterium]